MTVATWNIHSAIGTDGRFDLARTAAVLREIDAPVIALQEVGDFRGRTPHSEHALELGRALDLHVAFAPTLERKGRRYGNALLSRFPIAGTRSIDLSVRGHEPRAALVVRLDAPRPLEVACVHLGLGPFERRTQEEKLADSLPRGRLAVCGDFNHLTERPVRLGGLRDAACVLDQKARTCPSALPLFRFDRVFVSEGLEPRSLRVHVSRAARRASDHLPLVASLEVA